MASLGVPSRQQPLGEVQAVLPPAGLAGVAAVVAAAGDELGLAPAATGVGEAPVDTAGAVGLGLVLVVFEAPAKESVLPQPRHYLDSLYALAQAAQSITAKKGCCSVSAVRLSKGTPPNEPTIPETMDMACKDNQTSQSRRDPRYEKGTKYLEQMRHGRLKPPLQIAPLTAAQCDTGASMYVHIL